MMSSSPATKDQRFVWSMGPELVVGGFVGFQEEEDRSTFCVFIYKWLFRPLERSRGGFLYKFADSIIPSLLLFSTKKSLLNLNPRFCLHFDSL